MSGKVEWNDALVEHLLFMAYMDGWGSRDIDGEPDILQRMKLADVAKKKAKKAVEDGDAEIYT
jgi:hypothetical protein